MAVDDGCAVFDGISDFTDRQGLPAFLQHQLPGSLQDAGAHCFFLPLFTFRYAHFFGLLILITVLAKIRFLFFNISCWH
jgi:hypothetical protein